MSQSSTTVSTSASVVKGPCPICESQQSNGICRRCDQLLTWMKSHCAETLEVEPGQITLDASFMDDLNADSLDMVEVVMQMEDRFDLTVPDEDFQQMDTVGDAVRYVLEKSPA